MNSSRNTKRTSHWNLCFQYAALLLGSVCGLITVPVNLANIPLDSYGVWLACTNILAWATILDPGFSFLAQQKIASSLGSKDLGLAGKYIIAGLALNFLIALTITGISLMIVPYFVFFLGSSFLEATSRENIIFACYINCLAAFLNLARVS